MGAPTYVLVPGAGGMASFWRLVRRELHTRGLHSVAVDLPADDPEKGLPDYVDVIVAAAAGRSDIVLVAQSLGGFSASWAAARLPVSRIVLLNAMIPLPGETPGQWSDATGAAQAREEAAQRGGYGDFDLETYFLHDVDTTGLIDDQRPEADAVWGSPCSFTAWPADRVRVLVGADDRLFPAEFQQRIAKERLGLDADVQPGGHLIALAHPAAVADYLINIAGRDCG